MGRDALRNSVCSCWMVSGLPNGAASARQGLSEHTHTMIPRRARNQIGPLNKALVEAEGPEARATLASALSAGCTGAFSSSALGACLTGDSLGALNRALRWAARASLSSMSKTCNVSSSYSSGACMAEASTTHTTLFNKCSNIIIVPLPNSCRFVRLSPLCGRAAGCGQIAQGCWQAQRASRHQVPGATTVTSVKREDMRRARQPLDCGSGARFPGEGAPVGPKRRKGGRGG